MRCPQTAWLDVMGLSDTQVLSDPTKLEASRFSPLITSLRFNSHTTQFIHFKFKAQRCFIYSQGCATIDTIHFRTFPLSPPNAHPLEVTPHLPQPRHN